MNDLTKRLKQEYEDAERRYRSAVRRLEWLEHRLFAAETTEAFERLDREYSAAADEAARLGRQATFARVSFVQAEMEVRSI